MDLTEFRESYVNEDIKAAALNSLRYPVDVFIESAADILDKDYSLLTEISPCYYDFSKGTRAYKNMHIDAAYLDLTTNTLNLMYADFNDGEVKSITNESMSNKVGLLRNFFENTLKGFFKNGEPAEPTVQLARAIVANLKDIYRLHLFIVSTDKLSKAVKTLELEDYEYLGQRFKVDLDILDIEGIYRSKLAGFSKEDLVIDCKDFGIDGIPCIKAEVDTDQYESYLAIVPGGFLAEIYKKYSASLLEANVRSFLKFNGSVNKGIKGTILNEKSRFFTYNNGISTTAKEISTVNDPVKGLLITSFTDLQIINGGQTTATLAATNIRYNADLSGIFVQMKLTVLKNSDPDLIRNIATYANSQNKVKTADLNSGHPFYVLMENYSRKIYAPLESGQLVQTLWFFERARGQYEQPMMQMTKKQCADYKLVRPKSQKFTLTDLSKYINASEMMPHYVSWGGEVCAAHFHNSMTEQWEKDKSVFNELYYKELIAKKILFAYIERVISEQIWYQERRAYRPQLVAYTFSKFVLSAKEIGKQPNYRQIWERQSVPDIYYGDIVKIAKLVFDTIYDESRSTANIETYCKKAECWQIVSKKSFELSDDTVSVLITPEERKIEEVRAKKDQKFDNGIMEELWIFNQGSAYWESLMTRGTQQEVLTFADVTVLKAAVNYCNGVYSQLTKKQIKDIQTVRDKLRDNMIE